MAEVDSITIQDLQLQYKELYREHLEIGGQSILDNLLAFQRVIKFYTTPYEFDKFMASL